MNATARHRSYSLFATRLDLSRGYGKWLFGATVLVGVPLGFSLKTPGDPVWATILSSVDPALRIVGCLAAGVSTIAGGRSRRRHLETMQMLGARGPVAVAGSELLALMVWSTLSVVTIILSVSFSAIWSDLSGYPSVLRLLVTCVGSSFMVCLGYICGKLLPYRLTPAAVAISLYIFFAFAASSSSSYLIEPFIPANFNFQDEFTVPNPAIAPGRLAWFLGLGLILFFIWIRLRFASRLVAIGLSMGVLLSLVGGSLLFAQHGRVLERQFRVVWSCTGADPQICINPAFKKSTRRLQVALEPLVLRLHRTPFEPQRIEQRPRGVNGTPSPGAIAFGLDNTGSAAIDGAVEDVVVAALGIGKSCFDDHGQPKSGYDLSQIVVSELIGRRSLYQPVGLSLERAQEWFEMLTVVEIRSFLTRYQSDVRACVLRLDQFQKPA